ncbi:MAG: hypothetical protein IKX61_01405 [Prevotella sp.]|nr:hypothetical protein [Prevotella sp.]
MKQFTWDEYNNSQQEAYLDEENGADTEIVFENEDWTISAFKALNATEKHYFYGTDEDFAIVSNRVDFSEVLVYDCTLSELIEFIEKQNGIPS